MIWEDIKAELKKFGLLVALVALLAIGAKCAADHWRNRKTVDVSKAEVQHAAHVAQEKTSARVDTVLRSLKKSERALTAKADTLRQVADTIRQGAVTVRDSLEMWRVRDSVHVAETIALRAAKDSAVARADSAEADRERWRVIAEGSDRINAQLRKDLEKAEPPCRLAGFVPCPSRTASLAAGVLVGLAVSHPEQTKRIITLGR